MTAFWSGWVVFLVILTLGNALFLYFWAQRVEIPTQPDGTTGHEWGHGLREGVRKLPLWWALLSASLFVAAFIYLVLYPGFGSYAGTLGWTQAGEEAADTAKNQVKLDALLQHVAQESVQQVSLDATARSFGQRLFVDNCAACHGRDGHGNTQLGAPNLADNDWLYGGDGDAILKSVLDGRHGTMPPLGAALGETGITNVANYVLSLSDAPHDAAKAAAGKPMFAVCSACHGPQGKGNPILGAPNLTDKIWLYGGDLATVEETIRHGRGGVMPAWRARLGETEAKLVAAWVYAQSHDQSPAR